MGTTTRGYRYPAGGDAPAGPLQMQRMAEDVNVDTAALAGLIAAKLPRAQFTISANQSIPSAGFTTVVYNGAVAAFAQGVFALAAGVVTVPSAGLYLVQVHTTWSAASASRRFVLITKNGTDMTGTVESSMGHAAILNSETVQESSKLLQLAAGNTLQVRVFQDSGAPISVVAGATNSYLGTSTLTISRIGA